MNKILAVARWEYVEKVKSKLFLVGLFLTPAIILAFSFLPTLFVTQEDKQPRVVGLIDPTGEIAPAFSSTLEKNYRLSNGQPNYLVRLINEGPVDSSILAATKLVVNDQIEGFCIIRMSSVGDSLSGEYRSKNVGNFALSARMEQTLRDVVTRSRAAHLNIEPKAVSALLAKVDFRTSKLSKEGSQEEGDFTKTFFKSLVFIMMMFFLIATSGQLLVRSVIEEKSNRIIEVLVSSCSPTELMSGKILGLSALGLTQLAFWAVIGLSIASQSGNTAVGMAELGLLVMYFVLGYLFYSAIFIAAGSALNTEQEAQQINAYLILLMMVPVILQLPVMKDPDATWIRALSFVPFFTPTMMALRISMLMPSAWEIIATMVVLGLSSVVAMFAAGRIFRIGILATGKTPKFKELLSWIKTG